MRDDRPVQWPRRIRTPRFAVGLMAVLACACAANRTFAQAINRSGANVYPDTSNTAEAQLRNADNHAQGGQFAEAIEIYERVIQQFGDKVVDVRAAPAGGAAAPGPKDSILYVDARLDCQRRIAALPPEARAIYRGRADVQAERWFKQGLADRDRAMLRRVVEQAFCSSWGDDALEAIGDLAFEEGQFNEALSAYRRILPDPTSAGQGLVHPDPSVDLAKVAAKKLLCRAAIGENPPSAQDVAAFAKAFPGATGNLAGRTGPLAESTSAALADDKLTVPASPDGRWPTFAGTPTRTRVAPGPVDVGSLQWRIALQPINDKVEPPSRRGGFRGGNFGGSTPMQIAADRLLAYHPVVIGDQVLYADEREVYAYDLNRRTGDDGSSAIKEAWKSTCSTQPAPASSATPTLARYTLTVFGDRVYARIGPPPAANFVMGGLGRGMMNGFAQSGGSSIVALDRTADGKMLWKKSASEIDLPRRKVDGVNKNITFEGSPVADGRSVYVAITDRVEMTATYVACLDAENGNPRWVRYICEANNANPGQGANAANEICHRLLTLDGSSLYYQTNLGAVAALDVDAGTIRWLATYPRGLRDGAGGQGQERDLNPAVVANGLVIVAPDESSSLFAFDAATGRLAWTGALPDEVKLAHVLGVSKGRVIATGDRVLIFDVKDGKLLHVWPDGGQAPQGFGRGVLAGDRIYWPTKSEIHVLDQETGTRAEPPIRLESFGATGGNLAVGDGYLILAQGDSLVVFCQNRRLIQRFRDEIAKAPERASNYYSLAKAAEASGLDELALTNLEEAMRRAKPAEMIDGGPLVDSARGRQHRLLLKQGDEARKAGDWKVAASRFGRAAEVAASDRDRLKARLELADVQLRDGRPAVAVATLQALLSDERLRPLIVPTSDGRRSARADLVITDRLSAIVHDNGRAAYAAFDREAEALRARGVAEHDARLLADVGRSYPLAKAVPDAWLALGRLHDEANRPQEAARAYKKLLASEASDQSRARAYWGLARAYEAQRLWAPARDAYLLGAARVGDQTIETGEHATSRLGDLVSARLAREPYDRLVGDAAEPSLALPLARRWGKQWPTTVRPIAADGAPPSSATGRIFLVDGNTLRAVDPAAGASAWATDLGVETTWVGYLADRLIVGSRTKLIALTLSTGAIEWQYDLAGAAPIKPQAVPFARPDDDAAREAAAARFSEFRIADGRVVCLRGERTILAFDGDTGQVDWSFTPETGVINPQFFVAPGRTVFQIRKPNSVVVLETATGRRRGEFPSGDDEEWVRPPLAIDDDHLAIVAGRSTVAMFDLARGANSWTFQESANLPVNGPPRLVGDAERLFVIHDGKDLIRLDPATGAKKWSRPLGDKDLSERPDAVALSGDRFFFTSGSDLVAVAVFDGVTIWRRSLIGPDGGWSIALTDRCVVAYPNPAKVDAGSMPVLPVVFRRRDTGDLVQRISLPAPVTNLIVRLAPRGAYVATQAGLWALGDRGDPQQP